MTQSTQNGTERAAQTDSRFDGYSAYLQAARAAWHCPGLSVAISQDDAIIFQDTTGFAGLEQHVPLSKDSVFPIASCTKSFTAMSVALLVEAGQLSWDEPVRNHLPELVFRDGYTTEHVTVRDLLCHRTGLPRHEMAVMRLGISRWEMLERLRHLKPSGSFREKYQYCNPVYCIIPCLVERLTGDDWESFVQKRILDRLGITSTATGPAGLLNNPHLVEGYRLERGPDAQLTGHVNIGFGRFTDLWPGASGGMISTIADLSKWVQYHASEGRFVPDQLLSPSVLKEMHRPHIPLPEVPGLSDLTGSPLRFSGLGWEVQAYRGHTLVYHAGNLGGSSLMMGFVPQTGFGVVIASNLRHTAIGNALLFESLDLAHGLSPMDWSGRFLDFVSPQLESAARERSKALASRVAEAPPTHALEDYAGEYAAPGYPVFSVRATEGHLQARFDDSFDWGPLEHCHYDIFEWQLDNWDLYARLRFLCDGDGAISSVALPVEPAVGDIVFTRIAAHSTSGGRTPIDTEASDNV